MTYQASEKNRSEFELIEDSLQYDIFWSDHNSSNCLSTGWRVLPFWVILTVRKGGYICIFDSAEEIEEVHTEIGENEVLIVPAGIRHRLVVEQPSVADSLHIKYSLFHNLDVFSFYHVPHFVTSSLAGRLFQTVAKLTEVMDQVQGAASLYNITAKLAFSYQLFEQIILISKPVTDKEQKFVFIGRIIPALALVEKKIDSPLKVEEMAQACNLSRNAFTRLFKQVTRQTPQQYLTQKRLDLAMSKLVYSDYSIGSVAEQVGFCDQFHFSKVFRKERGETPSQYRTNTRRALQILT